MSDTAPPRRHRLRRILLWVAGIVLLTPVVLVLAVLVLANTGFGRSLIEREAASLTGGQVVLRGLAGRFPDALRLAHLEVHDAQGTWLTLDGVALDWSPLALIGKVARIDSLAAAEIHVLRLPVATAAKKPAPASQGGSGLPVQVDLRALRIARLQLDAPVAGAPAALRVEGHAHLASLSDATLTAAIDRLDGPGTYRLDGHLDDAAIRAVLDAHEPAGGLVSGLAKLPALGALALHATVDGPRAAERVDASLAAGSLRADAHGTVDLAGHSAALDVTANAPAMAPRPDVSWDSVALQAHLHGPFAKPDVAAHAVLAGVHGGGAVIASLTVDAGGNSGAVDVHAVLAGLVLPPPQPNLFAAAPLDLTVHAQLDQPSLPVRFALKHPLLSADGEAQARGDISARVHTVVPDLAPFAAIGHVNIEGSTDAVATLARHGEASDVTVDGTACFTGGQAPLPTALGTTRFGATARLNGQDLTITRATVDGRTAHASVTGTDFGGRLALAWHVVLDDLAALTPAVSGHLDAAGRVDGSPDAASGGTPATVSGGTPATVSGGTPATVSGGTPGAVAGGTPGALPSGTPGAISSAAPGGTSVGTPGETQSKVAGGTMARPSGEKPGEPSGEAPAGFALQADIKGEVGAKSVPRGPITAQIRAQGLPSNPSGTVQAQGRFDNAPLALQAELARQPDGGFHVVLRRADWRSLAASADLVLAKGAKLPVGTVSARMTRLADLAPLVHQPLAGSLSAKVDLSSGGAHPDARVDVQAAGLSVGKSALGRLSLTGQVHDPATDPDLALSLVAEGIDASGITGQAHATATGKQAALLLRTDAALSVQNAPATFAATAKLDVPAHQVLLSALSADYHGEALRLTAPAKVSFGASTGVDSLRLSAGVPGATQASISVAGRIAPTLALTAAIRNVTPDLARPFAPTLQAAGLLTADAHLSGTTAAPQGTLRLQATGVRLRSGPAASLKPASLLATVALDGRTAQVTAHVSAGPKLSLAATGSAPLQPGGALALHATGAADLTLLDPILGATGQRAAGNLALDATVSGSTAAPRINGAVTLARGEVQDFVQGLRVTDITANLVAAGDTVRIATFTAKAGTGTLAASGSVGVLAPGLPVDVHFTADHARPLASDLLTATLDADIRVHGQAATALDAGGRIFIRQAEINIPNSLPPSVATLNVRRPGDHPLPAHTAPAAIIRLALEVDAPNGIFVRGHGLDSELGGKLQVAGTTAAPQISGAFDLRRGDISVAGTTLTFSKGEVGFDGTSVTNKIDPTLNFVADSTSGGVTATLTVGGYADKPTIKLSSVPDLPQDEVLAHLLFGTSVKNLSAVQIAEIASALAELSGVTGGGGDPLGAVRKGLGLDRLSVGGGSGSGSGATIEAGRYVARGVFVGAKQATSGGGTAAEVQIDITKRLKAKAQLATGGGTVQGATPDNDPGSTIGLSYQFDY